MGCLRIRSKLTNRLQKSAPGKNSKIPEERCPVLKRGSWNVWTITPGLSENLQGTNDVWKTAIINNKLLRLRMDMAALEETRLADSGILKEKEFTFFWHWKSAADRRKLWVGFTFRNTLLGMVEPGDNGCELMTLHLHTSMVPSLSSVPTLPLRSRWRVLY